jgi:hypothetical protein
MWLWIVIYIKVLWLTDWLTPYRRVFLEKPIFTLLVNKFPTLYGTWKFITAFSNVSQMHPVHTFHPISQRYIVILSPHLFVGRTSSRLLSGFLIKSVFLICPLCAMCPIHLILLNLITLIIFSEAYKLCSSSLCSLLQPPTTSFLLGPNIPFSILFSNPFCLWLFHL